MRIVLHDAGGDRIIIRDKHTEHYDDTGECMFMIHQKNIDTKQFIRECKSEGRNVCFDDDTYYDGKRQKMIVIGTIIQCVRNERTIKRVIDAIHKLRYTINTII